LAGEAGDAADVDEALREQRDRADALLLGRATFEAFRSYWPNQVDNPSGTALYLDTVAKYVVSTTLDDGDLGWANSTVLRDLEGVRALKEVEGGDIVCTGSVKLFHSLMAGLVDEYRLFTYPVVVGEGHRLFEGPRSHLRLLESQVFSIGCHLDPIPPGCGATALISTSDLGAQRVEVLEDHLVPAGQAAGGPGATVAPCPGLCCLQCRTTRGDLMTQRPHGDVATDAATAGEAGPTSGYRTTARAPLDRARLAVCPWRRIPGRPMRPRFGVLWATS
jgi:dihydrofolate reductase